MRGMAALAKSWREFEYHIKSANQEPQALVPQQVRSCASCEARLCPSVETLA